MENCSVFHQVIGSCFDFLLSVSLLFFYFFSTGVPDMFSDTHVRAGVAQIAATPQLPFQMNFESPQGIWRESNLWFVIRATSLENGKSAISSVKLKAKRNPPTGQLNRMSAGLPNGRSRPGGRLGILGGGVPTVYTNSDPISDQKMFFSSDILNSASRILQC